MAQPLTREECKVIRRMHSTGASIMAIHRKTGHSRTTVRKYLATLPAAAKIKGKGSTRGKVSDAAGKIAAAIALGLIVEVIAGGIPGL